MDSRTDLPPAAFGLGYAGLLPQCVPPLVILAGMNGWRDAAMGSALLYASLILSFLGGLWWALAARSGGRAPVWLWVVAVLPSLIAFAAGLLALLSGRVGVIPLAIVGLSLWAALAVDRALVARGLCPEGWLRLRAPLSLGLGALTLLVAFLA
jgi:hypothetical protein